MVNLPYRENIKMETEVADQDAQIMDESLEHIFSSMIKQGNTLDAIDFIKSLDVNIIPNKNVLRTIIFTVLMKSDDIKSLALASDYLVTIINVFPPINNERRIHYYDSIRDTKGHLGDLWSVFSHTVDSYFYHRSIYDISSDSNAEPIKYPNCKFLLEFYVKLFSIDFEYLYVKSFQPCLIMQLLWPSPSPKICISSRTEVLLKWINDLYCDYCLVNKMGDLLVCLHETLTLMVKCFLEAKYKLSELAAYKHPCLLEVVEATVNFCKNCFDKPEKMKLFLVSLSSLKCFQARVSERIIKQVLKRTSKRSNVLTLRDIVSQYMFPQKINKWKNPTSVKPNVKEKQLRKRLLEKEKKTSAPSSDKKTDPALTLDFTVADLEGNTPLHLAVKSNSIGIVKSLLSAGGPNLLNIKDNKGFKPSDWSASKEMESLLQTYQPQTSCNDLDPGNESNIDKEAPNFKSFYDYSIYLHALTCLIGTYCELFNLREFASKKLKVVRSHANKECCHYLEENVCSEDAKIIFQMPDLIAKLIESLKKNATKLKYNIDIELIPLKALAASLKTS